MEMAPRNDHQLRPLDNWWREQPEELADLPEHIVDKLVAAGFNTVEQVRAAGPAKIKAVEGIGKVAFHDIVMWLRALD